MTNGDVESTAQNAADARLESALSRMTLEELKQLQTTLYELLRSGLPSAAQITKAVERHQSEVGAWLRFREPQEEAAKVVMLLSALAVAIAWLTHRRTPAPARRLQEVIATAAEGHVYMLPIPRCDPCFCGSGIRFKSCHGKPPAAMAAVATRHAPMTA